MPISIGLADFAFHRSHDFVKFRRARSGTPRISQNHEIWEIKFAPSSLRPRYPELHRPQLPRIPVPADRQRESKHIPGIPRIDDSVVQHQTRSHESARLALEIVDDSSLQLVYCDRLKRLYIYYSYFFYSMQLYCSLTSNHPPSE